MDRTSSLRKVVPRKELARLSAAMRARGERLVLTNGCFDLLHVGHVRYLEQARALGSALAVGLNDDASVRRLKGTGRPITPQDDRAEVLAALEAVDFVTLFGEDTAEELAAAIQPALYVKGGDYSADPESSRYPIEGRTVRAYGGEMVILDVVPGRSSSEIVRRIEKLVRQG